MISNHVTCGLFGDGPLPFKEGDPDWVKYRRAYKELIQKCILSHGCNEFICGMEPGAELLGAELVLELREQQDHLALWGVLSSEEQWINWSFRDTDRFFRAMEKADYEYRLANHKTRDSRKRQIRFIAQESDIMIVTAGCASADFVPVLAQASRRGRAVYIFDPRTLHISNVPTIA